MNWIDKAFGIHPQALSLRSQRSSVLAANIANADTPEFLARDFDFRTALQQEMGAGKVNLRQTNDRHLAFTSHDSAFNLAYRVPTKNTVNGNTVESEVEQAAFSENALRYQTSLEFLSGTINGLKLAIKGQ